MAITVPIQRMYPVEFSGMAAKSLQITVGLTANSANQSIVPGDVLTNVSGTTGRAQADNASAGGGVIVGLAESSTSSATPTLDDPIAMTVILPGFVYVGTFAGVAAIGDYLMPVGAARRDIADNAVGAVITTTSTNDIVRMLAPLGYSSRVTSLQFFGKADVTITAGQTTIYSNMGTTGDTNARFLFVWDRAAIASGQA